MAITDERMERWLRSPHSRIGHVEGNAVRALRCAWRSRRNGRLWRIAMKEYLALGNQTPRFPWIAEYCKRKWLEVRDGRN